MRTLSYGRRRIQDIEILPNQVRDWMETYAETGNKTVDVYTSALVVGLDIFIRNKGAASLTFSIDGKTAITVDPGDAQWINNTKFAIIAVTSTVAYDMILAGCWIREYPEAEKRKEKG